MENIEDLVKEVRQTEKENGEIELEVVFREDTTEEENNRIKEFLKQILC